MNAKAGRPALAVAALVGTMVLWGSLVPGIKVLLPVWEPFAISVARFVLGALSLVVALYLIEGKRPQIDRRVWILGLPIALFTTFYTFGIHYSNVVGAAVTSGLGPFVTAVMSRFLYREAPPPGLWLALPIAGTGCVLAAIGGQSEIDAGFRGGELLMVFAMMCWSWFSIVSQRWLVGRSQLALSASTMLTASVYVVLLFLAVWVVGLVPTPTLAPPGESLGLLLFIGVVVTAGGVFLWNYGVRDLGAPMAALHLNLVPVFAVLIAMQFGMVPTWIQLLGGGLVIIGVGQIQLRRFLALKRAG